MKTQLNEIKRMQQLAGILNENQSNEGEYSAWWVKANNELGLDFDDDIYSYLDSYDEPWQGKFAEEVTNIDADNYKDFKNMVKKAYKDNNPF